MDKRNDLIEFINDLDYEAVPASKFNELLSDAENMDLKSFISKHDAYLKDNSSGWYFLKKNISAKDPKERVKEAFKGNLSPSTNWVWEVKEAELDDIPIEDITKYLEELRSEESLKERVKTQDAEKKLRAETMNSRTAKMLLPEDVRKRYIDKPEESSIYHYQKKAENEDILKAMGYYDLSDEDKKKFEKKHPDLTRYERGDYPSVSKDEISTGIGMASGIADVAGSFIGGIPGVIAGSVAGPVARGTRAYLLGDKKLSEALGETATDFLFNIGTDFAPTAILKAINTRVKNIGKAGKSKAPGQFKSVSDILEEEKLAKQLEEYKEAYEGVRSAEKALPSTPEMDNLSSTLNDLGIPENIKTSIIGEVKLGEKNLDKVLDTYGIDKLIVSKSERDRLEDAILDAMASKTKQIEGSQALETIGERVEEQLADNPFAREAASGASYKPYEFDPSKQKVYKEGKKDKPEAVRVYEEYGPAAYRLQQLSERPIASGTRGWLTKTGAKATKAYDAVGGSAVKAAHDIYTPKEVKTMSDEDIYIEEKRISREKPDSYDNFRKGYSTKDLTPYEKAVLEKASVLHLVD